MIDKNDWRLLNDVDHLRGTYINPTDGEEICQNAKHLDHCVFCYFNEMFKWRLLDGYDIEWTLKDTIDTFIQKDQNT